MLILSLTRQIRARVQIINTYCIAEITTLEFLISLHFLLRLCFHFRNESSEFVLFYKSKMYQFHSHCISLAINPWIMGTHIFAPYCLRFLRYCSLCEQFPNESLEPSPNWDWILDLCLHFRKWTASSKWSSSLYWPMRNLDEMTIGKTCPTLI